MRSFGLPRHNRSVLRACLWAGIATALPAAGAVAASAAATGGSVRDASTHYSFLTRDNPADKTFNQLLGINKIGLIAGYYGSGFKGHPNKGYLLTNHGKGTFKSENFPGSVQTQVTGLDDRGFTVGFWSNKQGTKKVTTTGFNKGFYAFNRKHFHIADYPTKNAAKPAVDQLLGVNDKKVAVGFFNDSKNNSHGYTYSIATHKYSLVSVPHATSVTAAAINNGGDIAGFETNSKGATVGFLRLRKGHVFTLKVPGASMTQAFGLNDGDVVVGGYTVGTGSSAKSYGFTWQQGVGFKTVSDPKGVGATTVNGVNDAGDLVGFYTDSHGNTDGFVAKPR
jgi:hypothetical protein